MADVIFGRVGVLRVLANVLLYFYVSLQLLFLGESYCGGFDHDFIQSPGHL